MADGGNGGNITLNAAGLFISSSSVISASSELGIPSDIVMTRPETDIFSVLQRLAGDFLDASKWAMVPCEIRSQPHSGSFAIESGRVEVHPVIEPIWPIGEVKEGKKDKVK